MISEIIAVSAVLLLAVSAFSLGFYMGKTFCPKAAYEPATKKEITADEKRKTERFNKEISNMLSYDGTIQEEIDV